MRKKLVVRGEIAGDVASVPLTDGNIKNGHFYLRTILDFFPTDSIGGSDKSQSASRPLTVQFAPGRVVTTDITGPNRASLQKRSSHCFFRDRSAIRDFFALSDAAGGDTVRIDREAPTRYRVTLIKTGST